MEVSLLAVEDRERRQGVAARLLSHIEKVSQPGQPSLQPPPQVCLRQGARHLVTKVSSPQTPATAFFRARGWKQVH